MSAVLALLSALVWGTSDFGAGVLSRRLSPLVVIAWSQLAALVTLTVAVVVVGMPSAAASTWVPWAVAAGVAGSTGLLAFYAALASGTMGVVAPIAAVGAAVPVILGVLVGERPGVWAWVGIAVAAFGVVLASGPEIEEGLGARPVLLACVAAVGFGFALFALDRGSRVTLLHTLWGMRLTSCLGYLAIALVARSAPRPGRRLAPWVVLVGLGDLAANGLFGAASSMGLVSVASVLGSLYPVATVLLARRFLGERLRPVQVLGVTMALAGVALLAGAG